MNSISLAEDEELLYPSEASSRSVTMEEATRVKADAMAIVKSHSNIEDRVGEVLDYTLEEEAALVRKIDLFLMPMLWLMYLFSYADRTK